MDRSKNYFDTFFLLSVMKVSIFLKAHLHSLIPPFTEFAKYSRGLSDSISRTARDSISFLMRVSWRATPA